MTGYNFTKRVREVLAMGREEAVRLHHEYMGTEHMLLGLLREGEGVAATVLQNLGADMEAIRRKIETTVKPGNSARTTGPDLPYTSRAKKVLELSMQEARELQHAYVGTEHLLLGMLAEEKGIAAQVLVDSGVTLEVARQEVERVLGTASPNRPSRTAPVSAPPITPPPGALPSSILLSLSYANGARMTKEFAQLSEAIIFLDELGH